MYLYIVRHGEPDYTTDTLTERGRLQAEAVARRLAAARIDRVFSSPLGRARETAEPLCRLLGLPCGIEEWTREIDAETYASYPYETPTSVSLVQNTYYREGGEIDLGYDRVFEGRVFGSSGMQSALERITADGNAFLERLGYRAEDGIYRILQPSDERVALFCHGAMGRVLIASLLHIPLHLMWAGFRYTHTGVTVLEFKNNPSGTTAPACLCYSDMSHLWAYGPDTLYNSKKDI
jgi:probable phosphoglycerate mutase